MEDKQPFEAVLPNIRKVMQGNKARDTRPEMVVRRLLHRLGYRYRVYAKGLPGSPDLVFSKRRKVIFVHGCFWHAHRCKVGGAGVRTRSAFWEAKFARNKARDARVERELVEAGWAVLTIWECEVADRERARRRLTHFLGTPSTGDP